MDLGIAGRKAIVCASSKGLGRGCAKRLAEAGCEVVINGRNKDRLAATAAELRKATGAKIIAVAADVASPEGQKALFAACPEPDILVNNNAGPPFRDFRDLDRQKMIDGVIANMIVAVELVQKAIDPMVAQEIRPHRQHHLGLGEDAAVRPRPVVGRARRPHRVPRRRGALGRGARTSPSISCCRAFSIPTASARTSTSTAQKRGTSYDEALAQNVELGPGETPRHRRRIRRHLRVPVLGASRLHHRAEFLDRRRTLPRRILRSRKWRRFRKIMQT